MLPGQNRRILHVEDDQSLRLKLLSLLKSNGYAVMCASSIDESLSLARIVRFDLYLLDERLAGGSGIDLCRRLRAFDLTTPVLLYSSGTSRRTSGKAIAAGAQGYLAQLATLEDIPAAITKLLTEIPVEVDPPDGKAGERLN